MHSQTAPQYQLQRFSQNRKIVSASAAAGRRQNNIHLFVEADIDRARDIIRAHRELTGESSSLTAVSKCMITCA